MPFLYGVRRMIDDYAKLHNCVAYLCILGMGCAHGLCRFLAFMFMDIKCVLV